MPAQSTALYLLHYFVVYFFLAFVWASIRVYRQTGLNPLVLPKDDTAFGLVGFYFKGVCVFLFIYLIAVACWPALHQPLAFVKPGWYQPLQWIGLVFLVGGLVITLVAQAQMSHSWRIGIDHNAKTELVTQGLFAHCRNPIFLSMLLALAGLLCLLPNGWSLLVFVVAYVLIQVQIRMEEAYLEGVHGSDYLAYKQRVRRLLF
jgi:protein-S-isoprenylcysteine O-methyltransferase Ste14